MKVEWDFAPCVQQLVIQSHSLLYSFSRIIVVRSSRAHNLSHLRFSATLAASGIVSISGSDPAGFSKPSLPGSGITWKRRQKDWKSQGRLMTSKRQDPLDTTGDWDSTHRPAQVQTRQNPSTGKGKWTRSPTHNQEVFRNCCSPNPSKEKIHFICSQSVTRFTPILQGRPRAQKYFPTQSRLHWFSALVLFCYYFCLNDFLLALVCLF